MVRDRTQSKQRAQRPPTPWPASLSLSLSLPPFLSHAFVGCLLEGTSVLRGARGKGSKRAKPSPGRAARGRRDRARRRRVRVGGARRRERRRVVVEEARDDEAARDLAGLPAGAQAGRAAHVVLTGRHKVCVWGGGCQPRCSSCVRVCVCACVVAHCSPLCRARRPFNQAPPSALALLWGAKGAAAHQISQDCSVAEVMVRGCPVVPLYVGANELAGQTAVVTGLVRET